LDKEEIYDFFHGRPELLTKNVSGETVGFLPYDKAFEINIDDIQIGMIL
jgi:hypothetical protein